MKIINIQFSTKKGETQTARFGIEQEIPFPSIGGHSYSLKWENFGGLFREYGRDPEGIGRIFKCYLLVPDVEIPEDYNRTVFAGFVEYPKDKNTPKPGTIKIRGNDLGETTVSINLDSNYSTVSVREYNGRPTESEKKVFDSLIIPKLREFIEQNEKEIRENSIKKIKTRMRDVIEEARKGLIELENQIEEAIF